MPAWRNTTCRCLFAAGTFALLPAAGCYDAKALVQQVRDDALRSQTNEIDLGSFRTTMPRNPESGSFAELRLHLFGTVPEYRVAAIEKQLKADGYRLRADMLAAIRDTTGEELAEPNLGQLRNRLLKVANNILADKPIQSIGIQRIRIVEK